MTWQPEPRPEWLRSVNAGEQLMVNREAGPLHADRLLAEAQAQLGLASTGADWGDDDFLEPFRLVVDQLEAEANLTVFGRWFARRFLLRLLTNRLQLAEYIRRDPEVVQEQIVEPIFVVGAPRTGTTFLHTLWALDPARRAPKGWEFLYPAPPPGDKEIDHARVGMADTELSMLPMVSSTLDSIHTYRGTMLKECLSAMSLSFRSEEFISRYHVPDYVRWLQTCDMAPAYTMHRRVLQVLQRRTSNTRWVLKSPVHMHNLPELLRTYPDARLVVTHRDPLTVLASVTSLIATLRFAQTDTVDVPAIGRYHADLYCESLNRLVTLCDEGVLVPAQVAHVGYDALIEDPLNTLVTLHEDLGLECSAAHRTAVADHLGSNQRSVDRPHRYSFDDLGMDRSSTRERLLRYAEYFDVEIAP